jgi:hypothetical protein
MHKSTRLIKLLPIILIAVSACGYDGNYRYACQDPANWGKTECEPPACKVDGMCTETLLGWDPNEATETVPTEEIVVP